jgi:inhibitor of KinA sporulation pathway (predicted exonuclease)
MHIPHVFGEHEHLFGFHCPASICISPMDQSKAPKIAVLMLTPGMLTSIGPSRLHVTLADALSRKGIPSFRFDLSGIGESLAVGSHGSSLKRASHEVQQAMDMLEGEYGYTRFMLFGLCSGADDAVASASEDERIIATCLMDACGYRTSSHFAHYVKLKYLPKVLSLTKWLQSIQQRIQNGGPTASTMPEGFDIREFPNREQSEKQIVALVERGVRFQFIYTGGVSNYYSYADQFFDFFPRLKNRSEVTVVFQPRWDHVAMLQEDRIELLDTIVPWFESTAAAI